MSSPTLGGDETLNSCDTAIITLLAGPDLSMNDINLCISQIKNLFSDECEVNIGVATSSDREDYLQLTVLTIKERTSANAEDLFSAPVKRSQKKNIKKEKKEDSIYNIQGELPLQELTSGVFENSTPTMYNGQNLDIPTYLRQGLTLDIGD